MRRDFAARLHVGKNVGPAEGVNGLFGIADQQQSGIRLLSPDTPKNTVLLRIGILEFIDHRHRKTLANGGRQRFTVGTDQRTIQSAEHVVKAKLTPAALFLRHGFADLFHRAGQHQIGKRQRFGKKGFNGNKQRMLRHHAARFGARGQKCLGKLLQRVGQQITARLFLRPGADLFDPFALVATVELTPVNAGVFN